MQAHTITKRHSVKRFSTARHRATFWNAAVSVTAVFALLLGASSPVSAETDDLIDLSTIPRAFTTNPSIVEFGLNYNSDDSFRFGDFTGLEEERAYFLGRMDLWSRSGYDSGSARFWRFQASNLGLNSRSIHLSFEEQGRFAFNLDYDQVPKFQSDRGREFFGGGGGAYLTLPAGWVGANAPSGMTQLGASLTDLEVEHERRTLGGGFKLMLGPNWKLHARYDSLTKKGTKSTAALIAASGGNPRAALVPEPIDFGIRDLDLDLEYATPAGQFKLGYTGSSFVNRDVSLIWQVPYNQGAWDPTASFTGGGLGQKSLPPENRFDQITASGGYNFAGNTRLTLNAALGRMKQDETFLPYSVNPNLTVATPLPRNSLDGEINTTVYQFRISSRPLAKLSLGASWRYDDRDNDTPRNMYIYIPSDAVDQGAITASTARFNHPLSFTKKELELTGRYRLLRRTSLSLKYELEQIDRTFSNVSKTRESGFTAKLKSQPTSFLSLAVDAYQSRRSGSRYDSAEGFLTGHTANYLATVAANLQFEDHLSTRRYYLADRDRKKIGLSATLMPLDSLNVGFVLDHVDDDFGSIGVGLADRRSTSFTMDVSFAPTEWLNTHAFLTIEEFDSNQGGWEFSGGGTKLANSLDANRMWTTTNKDRVHTLGVGIDVPLLGDKLSLEIDYLYSQAREKVDVNVGSALTAAAPFPDTVSRLHNFRVGLDYKMNENVTMKLGYLSETLSMHDWQYEGVLPATMSQVIATGDRPPDYGAYLLSWSFEYKFW